MVPAMARLVDVDVFHSREDGVRRVIKGVRPGRVTPTALMNLEHEINVMKQCRHPNCVLLYEGVYCEGLGMSLMDMDRACSLALVLYHISVGENLENCFCKEFCGHGDVNQILDRYSVDLEVGGPPREIGKARFQCGNSSLSFHFHERVPGNRAAHLLRHGSHAQPSHDSQ